MKNMNKGIYINMIDGKPKITGIKTDKGRIRIAGLATRDNEKLILYGWKWIKEGRLLRIINTKWIVVDGISISILHIVQLNFNPINLFWIVFWKLRWKFLYLLHFIQDNDYTTYKRRSASILASRNLI